VKTEAKEGNGRLQLFERIDVRRGQMLERDRADSLYLVRYGSVEVVEGGTGSRVVGPGQFFGELDFTKPCTFRLSVRALQDSSLLRIDGEALIERLRSRRGGRRLKLKRLLGCGDRLIFLC